jgi:hypothetical protein
MLFQGTALVRAFAPLGSIGCRDYSFGVMAHISSNEMAS